MVPLSRMYPLSCYRTQVYSVALLFRYRGLPAYNPPPGGGVGGSIATQAALRRVLRPEGYRSCSTADRGLMSHCNREWCYPSGLVPFPLFSASFLSIEGRHGDGVRVFSRD